jgi:hypothetical protein
MTAIVGTYKQLIDDPESWCNYVILLPSMRDAEIAKQFIIDSQEHLDGMFSGFTREEREELFNEKVEEFKKTVLLTDQFHGVFELVQMIIVGDEYDHPASADVHIIQEKNGLVCL